MPIALPLCLHQLLHNTATRASNIKYGGDAECRRGLRSHMPSRSDALFSPLARSLQSACLFVCLFLGGEGIRVLMQIKMLRYHETVEMCSRGPAGVHPLCSSSHGNKFQAV